MSTEAPVALHALVLQRGDRVLHLIGIACADRDIGAFAGQRVRNGASDAARAAEHDGVLAFEMKIHVPLPCLSGRHFRRAGSKVERDVQDSAR